MDVTTAPGEKVRADQVSKTAPTGEYLQTGSFMIRGKKNFLPPCHLVLGLSIMFNLEESSISRHANERCVRVYEDSDRRAESEMESIATESVDAGDAHSDKNDIELEVNEESDEEAEPNELQFPDTHVKIPSLSAQISHLSVESSISRIVEETNDPGDEEENAIILPVAQQAPRKNRVISKANKINKKNKAALAKADAEEKQQQQQQQQDTQKQKGGLKRGQRSKLKKIKEKYKDQDEEEKLMRMGILKSAGSRKNETGTGVVEEDEESALKESRRQQPLHKSPQKAPQEAPQEELADAVEDPDQATEVDAEPEEEETPVGDGNDLALLNSLTGLPHELDELLFALPVVAPYNALQHYKHKVKITPGTARRGKASKMVLQMFLKDKTLITQEKDLIKAIKPDAAARNMPGKVKVSATQSQRK